MNAPLAPITADAPVPGAMRKLAPGLFWARLPLPFRLNHVNVWLLEEADGWTAIDAGCDTAEIRAAWETLLKGPMRGAPLRRLIATHGHVDHIGLAGWLVERFNADLVGTFAEWIWARLAHMHDVPGAIVAQQRFLARHGVDPATAEMIIDSRARFIDLSTPVPGVLTEIRDGETLRFGGRDWRVIVTGGHAMEHASFHCERDNLLIAGDHLLPRITPVIAVFEMIPEADPLGDYLSSFARFEDLPDDVLVLPSHGSPYRGIHTRIAQLRAHHADRLAATLALLAQPRTALAVSAHLFPRVEGPENVSFALAETLAHINHLSRKGDLARHTDPQGRIVFVRR